jgi:hypothetical protein
MQVSIPGPAESRFPGFTIPGNIASDSVDGETIAINLETGTYFALGLNASLIWNCIRDSKSDAEVGEIDESEIESILRTFVAEGLMLGPVVGEVSEGVLTKFSDMEDLLLADPIHEVESTGWPSLRSPGEGPR